MPAAVPVYRYVKQLTLREYLGNIGKPHILLRWPAGSISGIGALVINTNLRFSRSHWENKLDGAIANQRDKLDDRLEFYSVIDENDTIFKRFGLNQRYKPQVVTKPPCVLFINGGIGMVRETADVEQVESVVQAGQGAQFPR